MNATTTNRKDERLAKITATGYADAQDACSESLWGASEEIHQPDGSTFTPEITKAKLETCANTPDGGWDGWLINSGEFKSVADCQYDSDNPWAVEAAKAYAAGAEAGVADWLAEKMAELDANDD